MGLCLGTDNYTQERGIRSAETVLMVLYTYKICIYIYIYNIMHIYIYIHTFQGLLIEVHIGPVVRQERVYMRGREQEARAERIRPSP